MIYIKVPSDTDLTPLEDAHIDYDIWNVEELVRNMGTISMEIGFKREDFDKAKELLNLYNSAKS